MQDITSIDDIEFANNPDPRCPLLILPDCSDSMTQVMEGETRSGLEALNGGLDTLVSEIHNDDLSKRRIELSVLPYGTEVGEPTPFRTVDSQEFTLPTLQPMGITNTGKALNAALDLIEERKQTYKQKGSEYYQPMLILISDGLSMDDLTSATERIKRLESEKRLSFFAIGVEGAEMSQLNSLGTKPALGLKGTRFDEMFVWISQSAANVSASQPNDEVMPAKPQSDWWEMPM